MAKTMPLRVGLFGIGVSALMKSDEDKGFLAGDKISFCNKCRNKGSTALMSEAFASKALFSGMIPATFGGAALKTLNSSWERRGAVQSTSTYIVRGASDQRGKIQKTKKDFP